MALEFDGTNDDFIINGWPVPNATTGTATVSCWFYFTALTATHRMWGSGTHMENRISSGGALFNDMWESTAPSVTGLVTGTWYHIVSTGDANTNTVEIYQDGAFQTSATNATGATVGTTLTIGTRTGIVNRFNGLMEDWRSYDRVLTAVEIATIYAARGNDGIVEGLTARFLMNEEAPGTVATTSNIKDVGPSQLTITTVNGGPVFRESQLRTRRRVA